MINDPALFDLNAVLSEFVELPSEQHSRDMDARVMWACLGKPSKRIYSTLRVTPTRPAIWNSDAHQGEKFKKLAADNTRMGYPQEHIQLLIGGQYYLFNDLVIPEITHFSEEALKFAKQALPPEAKIWADTDGRATVTIENSLFHVQNNYLPARALIYVTLTALISLKDYHVKASLEPVTVES